MTAAPWPTPPNAAKGPVETPPVQPGENIIRRQGEQSEPSFVPTPPTHVIWRDSGPEFVHPDGYSADVVEALPAGFWNVPMKADPAKRTFAPDLAAIQAAKWEEVKARREELDNGIAHLAEPLGPIQIDRDSKVKIHGLFTMALVAASGEKALPPGSDPLFLEEFTRADNKVVTLTSALALDMGMKVADHVSAIFAAARGLREQIFAENAAVESVLSIDVEAAFAAALASGEG